MWEQTWHHHPAFAGAATQLYSAQATISAAYQNCCVACSHNECVSRSCSLMPPQKHSSNCGPHWPAGVAIGTNNYCVFIKAAEWYGRCRLWTVSWSPKHTHTLHLLQERQLAGAVSMGHQVLSAGQAQGKPTTRTPAFAYRHASISSCCGSQLHSRKAAVIMQHSRGCAVMMAPQPINSSHMPPTAQAMGRQRRVADHHQSNMHIKRPACLPCVHLHAFHRPPYPHCLQPQQQAQGQSRA